MDVKKTYGQLLFDDNKWVIKSIEPHVAIRLKSLFTGIARSSTAPFKFNNTFDNAADLHWFTLRYPMDISTKDMLRLKREKKNFVDRNNNIESILSPTYIPQNVKLNDGYEARDYQVKGKDVFLSVKRILIGDELGLGKTVTAIISLLEKDVLPAFVVVQAHLVKHWDQQIAKFTNLRTYCIEGRKPYSLPISDVYIIKYTCLSGWVDVFSMLPTKTLIFDEIQELRRSESQKWEASKKLSDYSENVLGLSATPIYNYGEEIFNIMQIIKPDSLGTSYDFSREWCGWGRSVNDPKALGTLLKEKFLFLRRTREEVGRELPVVNTIIHTVDYDEDVVKESEDLSRTLALKVMKGSFVESGQAARELDMLARLTTGVAKANYVAEYVKFLVSSGEPVVLAGWHRDVYSIWRESLRELNPVFYTGSESLVQKEKSKEAFINGESDIFIISLRSGIGLDGLQHRCKTVIFGELDWSPKIHSQVIGRVDRDGQQNQVTAIYLISNSGSDLPIIDLLGVKSSQSHGIIDPLLATKENHTDESRIKILAKQYLKTQELQA